MHGPIPPQRYFPYLTWKDIATLEHPDQTVIIQPLGAIEQHGPHLPLAVDSLLCTTVVGQALAALDPAIPAYSLPPLYYGKSNEHWQFPGTISLSAETLLRLLREVGESIYRAGFRRFVLINGHGGQPQVLEIVARDLHQCYPDLMVFPLFLWRAPNCAAELLSSRELEFGIHAGDAETSLMLAVAPDQVRQHMAQAEFPPPLPANSCLSMEGKLPFAWVTSDLSASGVLGDPTVATVVKGDLLLSSLVEGWVQVITDIHHFQQPQAHRPDP